MGNLTAGFSSILRIEPGVVIKSTTSRTIVISETDSHYLTTVRLENGRRRYRGQARVPRWRQDWARDEGGVVLLEPILRNRRGAAFVSLLQAYRAARAAWRAGEAANDQDNTEHEEIVA